MEKESTRSQWSTKVWRRHELVNVGPGRGKSYRSTIVFEKEESAIQESTAFRPNTRSSRSREISSTDAEPISTLTVTTTVLSTTFVTAPTLTSTAASRGNTLSTNRTTSRRAPSSASGNVPIALPPAITTKAQSAHASLTYVTSSTPASTGTPRVPAAATTGDDSPTKMHKKAVVGGLSGSIAGLILVGLLVCWALRRRRKKNESQDPKQIDDSFNEKGIRPTLARKWTELAGRGSPKQDSRPQSTSNVSVDEDHRIIRMSTRHWPRPYAPGAGQGYRESALPGRLHVTNPDPSRSETPIIPSKSLLRRQATNMTNSSLSTNKPLPTRPQQQRPPIGSQLPTITIVDPSPSEESRISFPPTVASTPSFRSYPSISSSPVIHHHPPDDPFLTPLPSRDGSLVPSPLKPARPSLGATARTLSSFLHPFQAARRKAEAEEQWRRDSWDSTSTWRGSERSDPFDLDRPSPVRAHAHAPMRGMTAMPDLRVYDGT